MKLIFAIVQNDDSKRLIRTLVQHRISVTRISTTGGFLHGGNTTLMIGVEKEKLDETLEIIKAKSSTRKVYGNTLHRFPAMRTVRQHPFR